MPLCYVNLEPHRLPIEIGRWQKKQYEMSPL